MRISTLLAAAGAGIALSANPVAAQCRGPDSVATRMVAKYSGMMRESQTDDALLYNTILPAGLSQVAPGSVVLVTDRTTCSKAERAYSGALRATTSITPSGSVYVVKVGTDFAVRDPAARVGDYYVEMILDKGFKVKSRYMAGAPTSGRCEGTTVCRSSG